jgi:hypothetical protein
MKNYFGSSMQVSFVFPIFSISRRNLELAIMLLEKSYFYIKSERNWNRVGHHHNFLPRPVC